MEKIKIVIKRIILQFKLPFLMLFSRFTFLSAIYYTLLSKSFWREFNSVLLGRFLYLKRLNKKTENIFLLRRNVHRLEKGLLMIPRKPVFGIKYIEELADKWKLKDYYGDNSQYIGLVLSGEFEHDRESDMRDDETKIQFKERIKNSFPKELQEKCEWCSESYYDG